SGTLTVTATSTLSGAVTLSNPSINSLIYTNSTGVITALASSTAGKILMATSTAPHFSWEANTATGVSGLTAGGVAFANSSGNLAQSSTVFYWNDTSGRLGVGTNTPSTTLHVVGSSTFGTTPSTNNTNPTNVPVFISISASGTALQLQQDAASYVASEGPRIDFSTHTTAQRVFASIRGGPAVNSDSNSAYLSFLTSNAGSAAAPTEKMAIYPGGNIGIGSGGGYTFGNATGGAINILNIVDAPTANPTAGGLLYVQAAALKYRSASGTVTTVAAADYSEDLPAKDDVEHGDLVSLSDSPNPKADDRSAPFLLQKSQEPYDQRLMGIVSSFAGDTRTYGFYQPIAQVGRVPAKVSTENGPIAKGDAITSSAIPGVGMRATKQGRIIGIALEPYSGSGVGKIMVFVNRTWYLPKEAKQDAKISQEEKGSLEPLLKAPAEVIEKLPDFVRNAGLEIKDKVVAFKEIFIEKLSALEIVTEKLKAKNVETETLQIKDRATGEPYCTWIEGGEWKAAQGECSNLSVVSQLSESASSGTTPSGTAPSSVIYLQPPLKPGRGGGGGALPLSATSSAPTSTPGQGVGSPPETPPGQGGTPPGQENKENKEKKGAAESQPQPQQSTSTAQLQRESLLGSILKALQNLFRR
ncbi:MAG: hypothetical protein HYY99_00935, partial [Candidatus Colwellbacteria bacterium]|nr:hypothetical protein [Candidatus Colwellbacteria bacterium]